MANQELPEESRSITKDLLEDAVRTSEGRDDVAVTSFSMSSIRPLEKDIVTRILRIKVAANVGGDQVERHLVAKLAFTKGDKAEMGKEMKLFDKEILVYTKLIPTVMQLSSTGGQEGICVPSPKVFKTSVSDEESFIIMEDCMAEGYTSIARNRNFDVDHCRLVVECIAKFHASVGVGNGLTDNLKSDYAALFEENLFNPNFFKGFKPMFNYAVAVISRISKKHIEDKDAVKRIEIFESMDIENILTNVVKPDDSFNVFCHADLNPNNILFKYSNNDSKQVSQVMLIDFQMVRYASPATDLVYFLFATTTPAFRRQNLVNILRFYHEKLMEYLGKMGATPEFENFTVDTLLDHYRKHKMLGVLMGAVVYIVFIQSAMPLDMAAILNDFDVAVTTCCEALEKAGDVKDIIERMNEAISDDVL